MIYDHVVLTYWLTRFNRGITDHKFLTSPPST